MVVRIGPKRPRRIYLREWREHRRLTQLQLAGRVETGKDQISRWESGKRSMGAGVLGALADALLIEPSDIFRDPQQPSVDELLRDASPEVRAMAVDVVRRLVQKAG